MVAASGTTDALAMPRVLAGAAWIVLSSLALVLLYQRVLLINIGFTEIQLHVVADTPELVGFFLREQGIPYEETSKRLRYGGERSEMVPVYGFLAEDTAIEVSVFSPVAAREAPLSPVDGQPIKRAGLKEVEAL